MKVADRIEVRSDNLPMVVDSECRSPHRIRNVESGEPARAGEQKTMNIVLRFGSGLGTWCCITIITDNIAAAVHPTFVAEISIGGLDRTGKVNRGEFAAFAPDIDVGMSFGVFVSSPDLSAAI